MQVSAGEISHILKGKLEGNPDIMVQGPSKIEEGTIGTISFLANPKYESFAYTTNASVLLVSHDFKPSQPITATLIRVDNVYESIALLLDRFSNQEEKKSGISKHASVHPTVKIGADSSIGKYTVVEEGVIIGAGATIYPQVFLGKNVRIGNNVTLHPGVKIYHDCEIGDNCILHANVVIGSDGFGFIPQKEGGFQKVPQIGNVIIEQDVEIGANTVIDRATMGSTLIKAGVKLDNLIQIAHNVEIGENTAIAAQAGVAGSTKIGKGCLIGGQAGFVGHIKVADGVRVQAQSGVATKIDTPNTAVYGSPALSYRDYLKSYAIFRQLPELSQKIKDLERELAKYEGK